MSEKQTGQDVVNSMNGFDEIAVKKYFGVEMEDLGALRLSRALAFTVFRRDGLKDHDAHEKAMNLTQGEMKNLFADPNDEDGFTQDNSEAGKVEPVL